MPLSGRPSMGRSRGLVAPVARMTASKSFNNFSAGRLGPTSALQERIVQELELARYGYQVDAKDPAFFSAFPDGRHFFMWQDRAKTLAEIAKFSRHDADVYPAYEEQLERLSQVVEGLLLTTPPAFPLRASDLVDYLRLAGKMRKLGPRDLVALVKIFTQSAAEFLDEWFQSEEVKF